MRVAIFSDTYPPQINGVATACKTIEKILVAHSQDVLVVTIAKDGEHHISQDGNVVRIPGFHAKKLYNYQFTTFFSKKVFEIVKKFNPDVIHIHTEVGIGIFGRIMAKKLKIPLVYTYHTMYEDYTYYVTKGIRFFDFAAKKAVASLSVVLSDSTTEFTTTSLKTKNRLRAYGVKKYINVVPIGLDFSMFERKEGYLDKVKEIRDKYDLNGKFVILILGRLAKEKSNDVILTSLEKFLKKKQRDDIRLMIVGDGPDKPDLENLARELHLDKEVIFVGKVPYPEVRYYYFASDLFVSASVSETQGLTYTEAMAAKIPVLARYDKNLDGVIVDNETGFFFEDYHSFETKLEKILSLDKKQIEKVVNDAYATNVNNFSLETFYKRLINVYNKAIRKFW